MKPEKLYELLGGIDENLLERAAKSRKTRKKAAIIRIISVAACLVLVVTGVSIYAVNRPINNDTGTLQPEQSIDINDSAEGSTDKEQSPPKNNESPQNNNSTPPQNNNDGSEQNSNGSATDPVEKEPASSQPEQPTIYPVVSPIAKILGTAVYPTMPQSHYLVTENGSDYSSAFQEYLAYSNKIAQLETDKSGNAEFVKKTFESLMKNNGNKNLVYSPSTLYFALSMLAETANGNTQTEILNLLGKDSIKSSRQNTHNLWQKFYCNDGLATSITANSLWLADGIKYNQKTIDILKDQYYASTFSGDFKTQEYSQAMRNSLNEQTGGLLKDHVQKKTFAENTVMSLASTIYYDVQWTSDFSPKNTKPATFHGANGDVTVDFMNMRKTDLYYWADSFSAIKKSFNSSGNMIFILPDEDKTVTDVLADTDFYKYVSGSMNDKNSKEIVVNLSVPKFDIEADLDITNNLKSLGVNSAFGEKADFSPVTTATPLWVDKVNQTTRVAIDEKGCVAASYVDIIFCGSSMPPDDEVDFVLDRPFIFVITGVDDLPRFIGVVNQP